jgi:hypothetical protein
MPIACLRWSAREIQIGLKSMSDVSTELGFDRRSSEILSSDAVKDETGSSSLDPLPKEKRDSSPAFGNISNSGIISSDNLNVSNSTSPDSNDSMDENASNRLSRNESSSSESSSNISSTVNSNMSSNVSDNAVSGSASRNASNLSVSNSNSTTQDNASSTSGNESREAASFSKVITQTSSKKFKRATLTATYSNDINVVSILHTVFWILEKAARAVSMFVKANDVRLALSETKLAVQNATETVEKMGTRLAHAYEFLTMGLQTFLQFTAEGKPDALEWLKVHFSDAVDEVTALAFELDDLLGISRSVVKVMKKVRSIADDAKSFSEGLLDIDLDAFLAPLEKQVEVAALSIEKLAIPLHLKCSQARAALEELFSNPLAEGKEYAEEKARAISSDLIPFVDTFKLVHSSIVEPLVLQLAKAIKAACKKLHVKPLDTPESVADETIDSAKCSQRQTHWFKSIQDYNVDIQKTMVCETGKTLGRWFKCRCVGKSDCYIPRKYRPEAEDFRRCFKML